MASLTVPAPGGGEALLRLVGLSKSFSAVAAVKPTDLRVANGDFVAILGPSGCGKTTLLRMIAGFVRPSAGRILIDGRDVTALPPEKRPTNIVFQGYGLFPHMSVRQNVGYGLRLAGLNKAETRARVDEALRLGRIEAFAERGVTDLSGGQQQRVALARALIMRPKILLLDEPLAALDLKLRTAMQDELRRLHGEIGGTFVFVTHDQGEALALATRIIVMNNGVAEQEGPPADIYNRPRTRFVAGFIGETNLVAATRRDGALALRSQPSGAGLGLADPGPDGEVTIVVRPEKMVLGRTPPEADIVLPARVESVVFLGAFARTLLRTAAGEALLVQNGADAGPQGLAKGDPAFAGWRIRDQIVLDEAAPPPGETPA